MRSEVETQAAFDRLRRRLLAGLSGRPNTQCDTGPPVTLHTRDSRLVRLVEEALSPRRVTVTAERPTQADLVVTGASLTQQIEFLAARMGTYVVVLPEAGQWLADEVTRRGYTRLVGSDFK